MLDIHHVPNIYPAGNYGKGLAGTSFESLCTKLLYAIGQFCFKSAVCRLARGF